MRRMRVVDYRGVVNEKCGDFLGNGTLAPPPLPGNGTINKRPALVIDYGEKHCIPLAAMPLNNGRYIPLYSRL